jgi:TusA-related sulfurtransferase
MNDLELDVRPILLSGGEPFGAIMASVERLQPGQRLRLFATFKPVPLFQVMARRGYDNEAREIGGGDWEVIFTPAATEGEIDDGTGTPTGAASAAAWPDPARYLDCTEMDPPQPLVEILAALEAMPQGDVLFALLGREPVFLFPELKTRGHAWVGDFDETGKAYRLMVRAGAGRQA